MFSHRAQEGDPHNEILYCCFPLRLKEAWSLPLCCGGLMLGHICHNDDDDVGKLFL